MTTTSPSPGSTIYKKHFIPLESNPELFTQLIHQLGISPSLAFQDVYSIEDPDLLSFISRPVLALILVFPTSEVYERHKVQEEATARDYGGAGDDQPVMWFKQTINNACGLYGILHAVSNGDAKGHIVPGSPLAKLLAACVPLEPDQRAKVLEDSDELEAAYKAVALQGDSEVPTDPEAEVDFHYVCFVKSDADSHIYELDGDRKGPVDRGSIGTNEDLLSERGLEVVKQFIEREEGQNLNFSLMALVPA
ncbi:ubiquitinyl hydrolase 1 [Coniosporium apollinis]|uniref:Ubiquitin carboxyl-terminal hydrolase n=1 Tax=Coniosporium apollinis TaxID=61459 RepID=A0ABQ9NV91_9PEZI|nr:ubiquitinyl hydrolase 1 [Coniosporium apollinis]